MKRKQLDQAYWDDAFLSFFIAGNYGNYADAIARFSVEFPEFLEHQARVAEEWQKTEFQKAMTKRIDQRFRTADQNEQDPAPTPAHLRQVCLPWHLEAPPMSQTVACAGQGRLSLLDASLKQQRRHQLSLKQFHRHGFVYREANEQHQAQFLEALAAVFPDVENLGDLALRDVIELLKDANTAPTDRDDEAASAPAPLR